MATTTAQREQTEQPETRQALTERISELGALDPYADLLQGAGRAIRGASPKLQDLLSGTRLGHPLHPPLTDVVVGAWTSSLVLDVAGGRRAHRAADLLVGLGVVAAAPTALAGLVDSADLQGPTRRVALVHALGNSTALALFGLSWLARSDGHRGTGRVLSMLGFGVATGSAWLGGHLSFRKGVGVNQTAFEPLPTKWTAVLDQEELEEATLGHASADGADVVIVKRGHKLYAFTRARWRATRSSAPVTGARSPSTAAWSEARPRRLSPCSKLACAPARSRCASCRRASAESLAEGSDPVRRTRMR
jgi:uncharacterized membrane protein